MPNEPDQMRAQVPERKSMKKAIKMVLMKKLSLRMAAGMVYRKLFLIRQGGEVNFSMKKARFGLTFNENYEKALPNHMVDMANRFMPLKKKEFLKLAFDLAEKLKLYHRFNKINKKHAGKHFFYDFLKRHPEISLHRPKLTSLMRAVGFNRPKFGRLYKNSKELFDKHNFDEIEDR
jgi:hypothetical protein